MSKVEKASGSLRGSAALANVFVVSLLAIVVGGLANYLSFRHFERWDLTSSARFAVSSRTRAVVRGLRADVTLYLFLSERAPTYVEVRELVRKYESMSPKLHVVHVDPDRQPARFRTLAQRFGIGAIESGDGEHVDANIAAVFTSGERTHKIGYDDLVSQDFGGEDDSQMIDVKTERALTSGIVAVTQGRDTKVCVTTGHGEWAREGGGERSLATIADEFLELDNIVLTDLALTPSTTIPRDCDAVFVIGPQRVFDEQIGTKLGAYVRGGGHLLVAVDPVFRDTSTMLPTGLEPMLGGFGIDIGKDVVVERSTDHQIGAGPVEAFVALDFGEHPITPALARTNAAVALLQARSVSARAGSSATVLLRGSAESFGETDLTALQADAALEPGAGDTTGPVGLAVAWSSTENDDARSGRIVVIGDTDLFETAVITEARFGNFDLLSSITGWLTARPQMISIAPRRAAAQSISATQGDLWNVGLRVMLLIPLAFGLLGLSVWWSRRA